MADRLVTVATYSLSTEAQLARNMLEAEGIQAILSGELATTLQIGQVAQIRLEVRAEDAGRAAALLAEVALEKDWEERAAGDTWACGVCGDAVAEGVAVCPTCATPRDAIRGAEPRPGPRAEPAHPEGVQLPGGLRQERPHIPSAARVDSEPAASKGGGCFGVLAVSLLGVAGLAGWLGVRLLLS